MPRGLSGARVVCLESRRAHEMAKLVEKQGGTALSAPSMKEVPLAEQAEAIAFAEALERGECDLLILLTGVGTRMLVAAMSTRLERDVVLSLLSRVPIYCRGPKPLSVLRELALKPAGVAPEPNTSDDLLGLLRAKETLRAKRVFVQEYGRSSPELLSALERDGALVRRIPVYAWSLPDDTIPLEHAVDAIERGAADAVVFTSAQQLEHLLAVAEKHGLREQLVERLRADIVVASIGPVTSEALARLGVVPTLVPEHPKMGQLVSELARRWPELSLARRAH